MKYLKFRLSLRTISTRARWMLLFFVALPIMAILGAGIINKLLVIPYLSEQAMASETAIAAPSGKLYSFYMLQAGVFASEDNARSMAQKLNASGFKAFSIKDGEVYRVVTGVSSDKSGLENYSTSLNKAGYITLCKGFEANDACLGSSPEDIKKYIEAAGELINAMLEYAQEGKKLDSRGVEAVEGYAASVGEQYKCMDKASMDKLSSYNSLLLMIAEEYTGQAENLDKRMAAAYQCVAGYGSLIVVITGK